MREYWTVSDVAREGNVAAATVRLWARKGALPPVATTPGGIRLFDPKRVRTFLARRSERREAEERVTGRGAS